MIKQMNYDSKFISLMTELAAINPQLIFKQAEDKVSVKAIEAKNKSICFFLDAPADAFKFESESLAVIDFNRLVSYFNTFNVAGKKDDANSDSPILSVEYSDDEATEAIVMHIKTSKQKAAFRHRLANEDVIVKPNFSKIKFPTTDATFALSKDQLDDLNKMQKLTAADRIKWAFHDSVCTVTLFNTRTNDTYENDYIIDASVDAPFDFTTVADGIGLLPDGGYKIVVSKAGIMSLTQDRTDAINLELYIAKTGK